MTEPAASDIDVTLLLCDSAQSIGGKLYVMGGGWTHATLPGPPISMALAVRFLIPWGLADQRFQIGVVLRHADGRPVDLGEGEVGAQTELGVTQPLLGDPDEPISAVLALQAGSLPLSAGRYAWVLEINGVERARAPFVLREAAAG